MPFHLYSGNAFVVCVCTSPCLRTLALGASPVSRALSSRVPSLAPSFPQLPARVTSASERPSLPTCHSLASSLSLGLPPDTQLFFIYHYYCCHGFGVFETGSYSSPGCPEFHYRAPGWPQTHGEPSVSVSKCRDGTVVIVPPLGDTGNGAQVLVHAS